MFRDRVVSMEQTLEGGEKHLPLLSAICAEALPGFELREHSLEHERDLFVMDLENAEGVRRRICWTRMVLFDAERIPTLASDPAAALRAKIVDLLRAQAGKPEILVTFRHLEEGWVDTPEPRREGRRRRRGRGGRGAERGGEGERPAQGGASARERERPRRPPGPPGGGGSPQRGPVGPRGPAAPRGPVPQRPGGGERRPSAPPVAAEAPGGGGGAGGKRRRRRRRRGRGPGSGAAPGPGGPSPAPGRA
jgi:hypothetical protein